MINLRSWGIKTITITLNFFCTWELSDLWLPAPPMQNPDSVKENLAVDFICVVPRSVDSLTSTLFILCRYPGNKINHLCFKGKPGPEKRRIRLPASESLYESLEVKASSCLTVGFCASRRL